MESVMGSSIGSMGSSIGSMRSSIGSRMGRNIWVLTTESHNNARWRLGSDLACRLSALTFAWRRQAHPSQSGRCDCRSETPGANLAGAEAALLECMRRGCR